jgi:copper(I)-binding protein
MSTLRLLLVAAPLVAAPALAQVTVSDAWVRGTVPGQRTTGAFMTLTASEDVALGAARTPLAGRGEVHEMKMDGGMMRMRAIDRLPVAKGAAVQLSSGGHHLMLMALVKPVAAGDTVPLSLTFEDRAGKRVTVDVLANVRPLAASHGSGKH